MSRVVNVRPVHSKTSGSVANATISAPGEPGRLGDLGIDAGHAHHRLGPDEVRPDRHDRDATRQQWPSRLLGDPVERSLSDAVGEVVEVPDRAGRAHVDDEAAPGARHDPGRVMGTQVRGTCSDVDQRVPIADQRLPERDAGIHVRRDPERVVDHHVQSAVLGSHPSEEPCRPRRRWRGRTAPRWHDRRGARSPRSSGRDCRIARNHRRGASVRSRTPSRRPTPARSRNPCRCRGSRRSRSRRHLAGSARSRPRRWSPVRRYCAPARNPYVRRSRSSVKG